MNQSNEASGPDSDQLGKEMVIWNAAAVSGSSILLNRIKFQSSNSNRHVGLTVVRQEASPPPDVMPIVDGQKPFVREQDPPRPGEQAVILGSMDTFFGQFLS